MTFSNFALRYHKNIDHWVIYHLKDVCKMCGRKLNRFILINVVPCCIVVDGNVTFLHDRDKCVGGCSCGKMSGKLSSLLSMIISFLLYLSMYPGLLGIRTQT